MDTIDFFTAPRWLKLAYAEACKRDPVKAAAEAQHLADVLQARARRVLEAGEAALRG